MVFFIDKNGTDYTINQPEAFLSARALARRSKQNIKITDRDLPVSVVYKNSLTQIKGVTRYFDTKWMNGVLVEMDDSKVQEINNLQFVDSVRMVAPGSELHNARRKKIKYSESLFAVASDGDASARQNTMIGVDAMHRSGYRGEGMMVAIFDSGFGKVDQSSFFSHVFDDNHLTATRDFIRGGDDVFKYDTHGSKVFSCIAGYREGVFSGTATNANFVLCVTEDVTSEYTIEEYNWLFAAEYADSLGVDVINSSVGYSFFDDAGMNYTYDNLNGHTTVITRAATMAARTGMLVVSSNGNEGNNTWTYMNAPADADSILSVGAVNFDGKRAEFSSFGPTADGRIKPDVSAPGSQVKVILGESIVSANGTSFSSPLIAGLAAGFWQAFPQLTNMEVIQYLKITSSLATAPDTIIGYGIPNFMRAYSKARDNENDVVNMFVVFPNPVDNKHTVYIHVDPALAERDMILNFYDLRGTFIRRNTLRGGVNLIEADVSFLSPGTYILLLTSGKIKQKSKLVIL